MGLADGSVANVDASGLSLVSPVAHTVLDNASDLASFGLDPCFDIDVRCLEFRISWERVGATGLGCTLGVWTGGWCRVVGVASVWNLFSTRHILRKAFLQC